MSEPQINLYWSLAQLSLQNKTFSDEISDHFEVELEEEFCSGIFWNLEEGFFVKDGVSSFPMFQLWGQENHNLEGKKHKNIKL